MIKYDQFAKTLERHSPKTFAAFHNFLADSYLPNTYDSYSELLYERFFELPEGMKYAAYIAFLKDQDLCKDIEISYNPIIDAFKQLERKL
jgi:hypothetical protein